MPAWTAPALSMGAVILVPIFPVLFAPLSLMLIAVPAPGALLLSDRFPGFVAVFGTLVADVVRTLALLWTSETVGWPSGDVVIVIVFAGLLEAALVLAALYFRLGGGGGDMSGPGG